MDSLPFQGHPFYFFMMKGALDKMMSNVNVNSNRGDMISGAFFSPYGM